MTENNENVGPLSGRPPTAIQGPRRRAPRYYAGEIYGRHHVNHLDVERNADGSVPGIRDKSARRIIRKAFGRSFSRVEKRINFAREMKAQALEVARDEKKSTRWGLRLLAKELAIHQTVYCPDKKTIRAMRTAKRKLTRKGQKDFITQALEKLAEKK